MLKGILELSVRNAVTLPRAEGNGEYEYFVECSQNGQNYSYTYVEIQALLLMYTQHLNWNSQSMKWKMMSLY